MLRTLVSKVASLAGAGIKARNEWKAWKLVTAWVLCSPGWESSSTEKVFFHHCLFLPLSMAKTELWKLLDKAERSLCDVWRRKLVAESRQSLCTLYRTDNTASKILCRRKIKTHVWHWNVYGGAYLTMTVKMHRFGVKFWWGNLAVCISSTGISGTECFYHPNLHLPSSSKYSENNCFSMLRRNTSSSFVVE